MKSRNQRIKDGQEKSKKTVKIIAFAKNRLISIGIRRVLIDKIYKSVHDLNKDSVFKIYKIEFKSSAVRDYRLDNSPINNYKSKPADFHQDPWIKEYRDHLKSDKWKVFRKDIIKKFSNTCQVCRIRFTVANLHVHHLHYRTLGNERTEDVMLVCKKCHEEIHGRKF